MAGREAVVASGPAGLGERSVLEIGSVTKVFTGLALAALAREGVVGLEDPARAHLPAAVRVPRHPAGDFRLVDLASHSAGLPRLPPGFERRPESLGPDPYAGFGADDLYAALERTRPTGPPGRSSGYSNFGAGLLGHVLATAAGTDYGGLVRSRVTEPLGMLDTTTEVPPGAVAGHDRRARLVPPWTFDALAGAGALRSTGADLLRLARAALAGGGDLETALAPRVRVGRGLHVGLGWHVTSSRRGTVHWHNGQTGGFASFVGIDRERGVAVVVLSDTSRSVDRLAGQALARLARGARG